jgi:hypothetical protein
VYVKISAITHVVSEIGTYIINNAGRQAAQKVFMKIKENE